MKMFMIGNAHLDPVWTWTWIEGYTEIISTCISALNILDEYDSAVFTRGEAAMYEWIEENHPEIIKKIKHYVDSGRWNIVNGWWIQPDCNIPSGECFVRQGLYGKKYFGEKFGVFPNVAYNVDSFGHSGSFPQILKKSEYDSYVFMRPDKNEKELPTVFNWKSKDGSSVYAFRISNAYTVHEDDLTEQIEYVMRDSDEKIPFTMCFYGVGNHGGGPTKGQIEFILNKRKYFEEKENIQMVFGTPQDYFKNLKLYSDKLKTVQNELQYHSIGCYSVHSRIKKMNRKAESEIIMAEKWASISTKYFDGNDESEKLERQWKNLLFNQFHDILAGTSIKEACEDAENELGGVMSNSKKIKNYAQHNIAKRINTEKRGIPFIIFNSSNFDRKEYMEFEPWLGLSTWGKAVDDGYFELYKNRFKEIDWETHSLNDENGNEIEYQKIDAASPKRFVHRILFRTTVPSLGYKVLWLNKSNVRIHNEKMCVDEGKIYNNLFTVFYDESGIKINYLKNGDAIEWKKSNKFFSIEDYSDTWSHGIKSYEGKQEEIPLKSVNLVENGNLRAILKLEFENGSSNILQLIEIKRDDPKIRMHFKVNWNEKHRILKYQFRFNDKRNLISEIPYSIQERKNDGQEYPMQRFILAENDNKGGIAFINESKYSYDFRNDDLRLTILRSVPYAWHVPYKLKENKDYEYIDMGIQEFDISILEYGNRINAVQEAEAENCPMDVFSIPKFKGDLPPENSFIKLKSVSSVISSIKLSEDGRKDLIIRIVEYSGIADKIELSILGSKFQTEINPYEIKTLRYNGKILLENDLLEKKGKDT